MRIRGGWTTPLLRCGFGQGLGVCGVNPRMSEALLLTEVCELEFSYLRDEQVLRLQVPAQSENNFSEQPSLFSYYV